MYVWAGLMRGLGLCSCCLWALPAPSLLLGSALLLTAKVRGDPPFNLSTHADNGLTELWLICCCYTENSLYMFESTAERGSCESCERERHIGEAFFSALWSFRNVTLTCLASTVAFHVGWYDTYNLLNISSDVLMLPYFLITNACMLLDVVVWFQS